MPGITIKRRRTRLCMAKLGYAALVVAVAVACTNASGTTHDAVPQVIVFAGSAHYPPFEWRDASGQARGFDIALENAIAKAGGRKAVHVLSSWPDALKALHSGKADVVAMFASSERLERYAFTEPFYYASHAIFGPPGYHGVAGPASLAGKRVAVVQGGYAAQMLQKYFPAVELVPQPGIAAAVTAVADGSATFVLESRPIVARTIAQLGLPPAQISRPFWPKPYVFAVRRDRPELLAWLQRNLTRIQSSGRYNQIFAEWNSQLVWRPSTWRDSLQYIAWIAIPLLVLIIAALLWNKSLRLHVARKTQALETELARRREMEAALRHASTHSQFTQLPNRTEFKRQINNLLAESSERNGCIFAVHITNLKEITSVFGHEARGETISQFAAHLSNANFPIVADLRRGHFGIFAYAGDEAKLQSTLAQSLTVSGSAIEPQVAVGMASTDGAALDAAELLRRAETALLFSSRSSNPIARYSSTQEPDVEDLILVRDFKQFGYSDIQAAFQPQYDIRKRRLVGMEALVRWTHPTIGPISPSRFIPLLEQAGLAHLVTTHMVDAAIRTALECRRAGTSLRVSANISAGDLLNGDLPKQIQEQLQTLGGNASDLVVEITETGLIENPDDAARIFAELQDIGVGCSIDDFGTGYSSLTYLGRFSLSEIKIDRSFVKGMLDNPRHDAIVRWTTSLAHELGLRAIAEGVEDEDTLRALHAAGCDFAQGYLFAQPMPATEIIKLLP